MSKMVDFLVLSSFSESVSPSDREYIPRNMHKVTGIILYMRPANERRRYIVTSSLIGWAHTRNDSCSSHFVVFSCSLVLIIFIKIHQSCFTGTEWTQYQWNPEKYGQSIMYSHLYLISQYGVVAIIFIIIISIFIFTICVSIRIIIIHNCHNYLLLPGYCSYLFIWCHHYTNILRCRPRADIVWYFSSCFYVI